MPLARFENLLKEIMGLDVASVGTSVIRHAVRERQAACHLEHEDAYWERVQESGAELQKLVEAVVVPETWFFRGREAFDALGRVVHEEWLPSNLEGMLRVLSLPCSTGEEPYSIAMALLDSGLPANRFRVDAVDISAAALGHGRRGFYRKGSFRGDGLGFRDRHFVPAADGHQLSDVVRGQVRFLQGNLLSSAFLPGEALYDVVFCRNLFIYFDRPTQERSIAILDRVLAPRGFLFVGAAETGVLLNSEFVSARIPMAFAFRKAAALPRDRELETIRLVPRPVVRRAVPPPPPAPVRAFHSTVVAATPVSRPSDGSPERSAGIDEARQLADHGRFVEAALRCEEHLRQYGPSAEVFHLLGLIRDATGNALDATRYYRKALYLDPDHGEALMHLALLMEHVGRPAEAQVLRDRMKRLRQRSRTSHER